MRKTIRLDQLLVEDNRCASLKEAAGLIMAGRVLVDERVVDKPGALIARTAAVRIKYPAPFVSRAGLKLAGGLDHFDIDPQGWVCADIGASTGGFTDCLLQRGARRVYAIDVAYGILDWKIRSDPRVVALERTNARHLKAEDLGEPIDFSVFDASFISLTRLIPPVLELYGNNQVKMLALVKPQFELPRHLIDAGGIVSDRDRRLQAVGKMIQWCQIKGLESRGYTESPIQGSRGNQEYLLYLAGR